MQISTDHQVGFLTLWFEAQSPSEPSFERCLCRIQFKSYGGAPTAEGITHEYGEVVANQRDDSSLQMPVSPMTPNPERRSSGMRVVFPSGPRSASPYHHTHAQTSSTLARKKVHPFCCQLLLHRHGEFVPTTESMLEGIGTARAVSENIHTYHGPPKQQRPLQRSATPQPLFSTRLPSMQRFLAWQGGQRSGTQGHCGGGPWKTVVLPKASLKPPRR